MSVECHPLDFHQLQRTVVLICVLNISGFAQDQASQTERVVAKSVDYTQQVKPILKRRCFACHGRLHQKSGLRLDTALNIRRGGESGPAIAAGKAHESLLIQVLDGSAGFRMPPPAEGPGLTPQEIAVITDWINQGATAPDDEQQPPDPKSFWSYQRPMRPEISAKHQAGWPRNPIDSFVHQVREEQGLLPCPPAAPQVLLRRLYLDLIGLPPTVAELQAFVADHPL